MPMEKPAPAAAGWAAEAEASRDSAPIRSEPRPATGGEEPPRLASTPGHWVVLGLAGLLAIGALAGIVYLVMA